MTDVFISYARADRAVAEALAQDLQSRGFKVWWDADLLGSDDYYEVILEALRQAKVAIVIWSKASAKSRFVRDEARYALHLEKLVATKIADLDPLEIPFGFQSQHTDDVTRREQIVKAIEKFGARPNDVTAAPGAVHSERSLNAAGIDELVAILSSNPTEAIKQAAAARLKTLTSGVGAAAAKEAPNSEVRSLTASNWRALLSGFTLQVPKFQLETQGFWTAVGLIVAYGVLSAIVIGSVFLFTKGPGDERLWLYAIPSMVLLGILWRGVAGFVSQRNLPAAATLGAVFFLASVFSTLFAAHAAMNAIAPAGSKEGLVLSFWAVATLAALIAVIWKIRTAR